jgi:hypothetical protein
MTARTEHTMTNMMDTHNGYGADATKMGPTTEALEHGEGRVAKTIESQTAKLPSDIFLWSAGAAIVGSLALQMMGRKATSTFVGQWAPTLLILGLYNKIVKVAGSDRASA